MENQDIDLLNGVQLVGLVPQVGPETGPRYAMQPEAESGDTSVTEEKGLHASMSENLQIR